MYSPVRVSHLHAVADVHEQRHLDRSRRSRASPACCRRRTRCRRARPGSVSVTSSSTDAGSCMSLGCSSMNSTSTSSLGCVQRSASATRVLRDRDLLVGLGVHEVRVGAVGVEELHLAAPRCARRGTSRRRGRSCRSRCRREARRSFVRTNAPPLPGLTCWNSTILKIVAVDLDVVAVLELVGADHSAEGIPPDPPVPDLRSPRCSGPAVLLALVVARAHVRRRVRREPDARSRSPVDVDLSLTHEVRSGRASAPAASPPPRTSPSDYGIVARTRRISRVRPGVGLDRRQELRDDARPTAPTAGFRQFMNSGPWELADAEPAGCGSGPAPPRAVLGDGAAVQPHRSERMISGDGKVTVTRVGPAVNTRVPSVP